MKTALASEWYLLKVRKTALWFAIAWVGYMLVFQVISRFTMLKYAQSNIAPAGEETGPELSAGAELFSQAPAIAAGANANLGAGIMVVFGVILIAAEFRWGTWGVRFMQGPQRITVIGAKLLVAAGAGAGLGLIGLLTCLFSTTFLALVDGATFGSMTQTVFWGGSVATVLIAALWVLVGAGLGLLFRGVTWALVTGLAWLLVIENVLGLTLGQLNAPTWIAKILPARSASEFTTGLLQGNTTMAWPAAVVFVGWTVLILSAAATMMLQKDVR